MNMTDLPRPPSQAYRVLNVQGVRAGLRFEGQDCLATEVPVALEFNGVSHAVMMATPADLEDFAYGFALTEGIVDSAAQIHDCEAVRSELGYTLQLRVAESCFARLKEKRRNLTGRTGCGLCGTESLSQAVRQPAALTATHCFDASAVSTAVASLRAHQTLLAVTGATHAAAWCSAQGEIQLVREDVGRHNALDKLIGALLRERRSIHGGFVTITSRASYEMVQKSACMGISLLAAVSGATALAVDVAHQAGLTLVGFARGDDLCVYSHPERFNLDHMRCTTTT
jgi:formate dehydrogenase accessory protein FdhD